ncbi:membrane dipeptidase [Cellulomonas cellasea]|uniref:Peptidase M19 n=2 Tax=Cellulomonas cellasea TaxID=43670 RepID=A0A0A0BB66_9CELL|nr:membrane dipeptidase [Cellulomonas cellasea]KGM03398.1 hypothetical protein Q760_03970 [Cellulomonas cellasea DSM 20118]GEA90233.1 hypothetical protein CCE01nite_41820 [Cellulomonas cellasea]
MIASLGGKYAEGVNRLAGDRLVGLVDMHIHPAAHLGFGTELVYGAPDGAPADTLHDCGGHHEFHPFQLRGNAVRANVVGTLRAMGGVDATPGYVAEHEARGWPGFRTWPTWHDRTHQQARVEWLERAWQGGLRVVVALAVNSALLADLTETKGPTDDRTSADLQIEAIKKLAALSGFMDVVENAQELRRTVSAGRLAVVLGIEVDAIGNFCARRPTGAGADPIPHPTPAQVTDELDRLIAAGVRYFFPVHLADNAFGGSAVYEPLLALSTRYLTGRHATIEPAPPVSGITAPYIPPDLGWIGRAVAERALGEDLLRDVPAPPATRTGHRNARGLTALGAVAVRHLMRRGVLIDVDHMSERTVEDVLSIAEAERYPLVAGHTGVRSGGHATERHHSVRTLRRLRALRGLVGVGIGEGMDHVAEQVRAQISNGYEGVAIGSDASGLERLPAPRFAGPVPLDATSRAARGMVVYADSPGAPPDALTRCRFGERSWDFSAEGMAHIGLLPDLLEELYVAGLLGDAELGGMFYSAEAFAVTWEACRSGAPDSRWTLLDDNPATELVAAAWGRLFQLHDNGRIWEYTGVPRVGWAEIDTNPATKALLVTEKELYQRHSNGAIYRYTGTPYTGWQLLDGNPRTVRLAARGEDLFQLHDDGRVWAYTGTPLTGWAEIDTNPRAVDIVGADELYQLHDDGTVWVYRNVAYTGWSRIWSGTPARMVAASGRRVCLLLEDGSAAHDQGSGQWVAVRGPGRVTAVAAQPDAALTLHDDGSVWRHTTAGSARLSGDPRNVNLTASRTHVYRVRDDGHLLRWVPEWPAS